MRLIKVLLGDRPIAARADQLRELLGEGFSLIAPTEFKTNALVSLSRGAQVLVTSYLPDVLAENAPDLELVQAWIAGVDSFNLDILRRRNLILCSSHENSLSVAEHALGLVLACGRRIVLGDRRLRTGRWSVGHASRALPHTTVYGKTVGIVGFGAIGQAFTRFARGLDLRILAIKRRPDDRLKDDLGIEFLGTIDDLGYVLANADFVLVALPKTPDTKGLIGEKALKQMKPTAHLIQVGRADTIDEESLYLACKERWIAGAAIDTWSQYPPPEPCYPSRFPFHELDNVVMTPHSAAWTSEAIEGQIRFVADNLRRYREGRPLERLVDYDLAY